MAGIKRYFEQLMSGYKIREEEKDKDPVKPRALALPSEGTGQAILQAFERKGITGEKAFTGGDKKKRDEEY